MSELFLSVLNMSLTASYVILFVILVRLLLKKAPKVISYALWGVVAFRLIIPFSFESMFSLMPRNTNAVPIPYDIIYQQNPQINSVIEVVDSFVRESLPAPIVGASVNSLQIYTDIGAYIWILGIMVSLIYSLVSVLQLKRQLKSAQLIEQNIYEAKNLKTPFVLGLIRPKIYLPVGLNVEERSYILLHEQTHIQRKDHIIKVLAFLTLSIHWLNPLVWIAFMLMNTDMELSCDEQVLKEMNEDIKKPYANSLLSLATGKHILNGSPLAFGEGNVKGRIKNVLNYKKPRFWVIVFSIVLVTAVGIGLMANPKIVNDDTNTKGDSIKGGNTIQQAMDYYLWEIESSMGQRGTFYTGRYRILAAEETPVNVLVHAWVVSKWIDSKGNTVSGGSGIYEISFKIENNLYIYEFVRDIKIPEVPYIPQHVSDIVRNDGQTIYAELIAEIEKDTQNHLGEQ